MSKTKKTIRNLALGAVFTALVVVLQLLGTFVRFGPFAISLVLVPIVLGAALCDWKVGAWLGFMFGFTVLVSGDAAAFLTVSVPGTVVTVLLKGIACGLAAGLVYKAVAKKNRYLAIITAAVVCPLVNTGIFLLGCKLFFMETIAGWAVAFGFQNATTYLFVGMIGANFLIELVANILLAPAILRIVNLFRK